MKILCVTHSSRPFLEARSSLNGLEQRFGGQRTNSRPPFESLPGKDQAVPFNGSLTLWAFDETAETPALRFLWSYDPGYKIQSATFVGGLLVICGSDRLEILNHHKELIRTIQDPWLCGGHTVFADAQGDIWVTSAPANAALKVNLETGSVVERLLMPHRYGTGYDLGPDSDIHEHFVPTDLQPTHVNCAYPVGDGLLVTLLIPGVVGRFDGKRHYREIVTGLRGCHGGKLNPAGDELYVTDSASGLIWFFDPNTGKNKGRLKVDSQWLHDSHYVSDTIMAAGLSDRNVLCLIDRSNGAVLLEQACGRFGKSVMFVNCCEADSAWAHTFSTGDDRIGSDVNHDEKDRVLGPNLLAAMMETPFWHKAASDAGELKGYVFLREESCNNQYLMLGPSIPLRAGDYILEADVDCRHGQISLGLLAEAESDYFLTSLIFDSIVSRQHEVFAVDQAVKAKVSISARNGVSGGPVEFVLRRISLRMNLSQDSADCMECASVDPVSGSLAIQLKAAMGKIGALQEREEERAREREQERERERARENERERELNSLHFLGREFVRTLLKRFRIRGKN